MELEALKYERHVELKKVSPGRHDTWLVRRELADITRARRYQLPPRKAGQTCHGYILAKSPRGCPVKEDIDS